MLSSSKELETWILMAKRGIELSNSNAIPPFFIIREQGQTNSLFIAVFSFGATCLKPDFSERYSFLLKRCSLCLSALGLGSRGLIPPGSMAQGGSCFLFAE